MTSRERVRAVLAHKIPDRIPNGLGGCETAGLHIAAYDTLKRILGTGLDTPTAWIPSCSTPCSRNRRYSP